MNELSSLKIQPGSSGDFIIPERRFCTPGGTSSIVPLRARNATFISDETILKIHPMKFLPNSPFVKPLGEEELCFFKAFREDHPYVQNYLKIFRNQTQGIAITPEGKHVILQQTTRSCVPTCVGMLVLDRGKIPDYRAMQTTDLATREEAIRWIETAGLKAKITPLPFHSTRKKIELLAKALQENGAGALSVDLEGMDGHVIVLDNISIRARTAIIRDPGHGWMLTIPLDTLISLVKQTVSFLQIEK